MTREQGTELLLKMKKKIPDKGKFGQIVLGVKGRVISEDY